MSFYSVGRPIRCTSQQGELLREDRNNMKMNEPGRQKIERQVILAASIADKSVGPILSPGLSSSLRVTALYCKQRRT